jgi:hypothetical protein
LVCTDNSGLFRSVGGQTFAESSSSSDACESGKLQKASTLVGDILILKEDRMSGQAERSD